ncbi:GTP-binding protein ypt1 [Tritrichomonas foetus]|uniref:GTP-binding protein ypt1 n=1 Tax=Tritrichomonas foetus TaxID=1144522 RepID=A0A1J4K4P4_9EUKA|nr:GTP-binding protein ypt1 [Tritrichomonas foetus]|eukprot:OHT06359.1 GTP-binding protein ypt1 [Tritrichomonas foetus]
MEADYYAKVVLLGESGVGKTSIASRYVEDSFNDDQASTIGASYLSKTISINSETIELSIWDTAGQEVFRTLTPMYYRDAAMAIIVFSLDDIHSFECVKSWIDELKEKCPDVQLLICGNKSDLADKKVKYDEANDLAASFGVPYAETSALNGEGVDNAFELLATNYINSIDLTTKIAAKNNTIVELNKIAKKDEESEQSESACC